MEHIELFFFYYCASAPCPLFFFPSSPISPAVHIHEAPTKSGAVIHSPNRKRRARSGAAGEKKKAIARTFRFFFLLVVLSLVPRRSTSCMTSNPYIAQHYGSSMELMAGGRDAEDVDAAVGFRRFPNAAHMTHTVFRPKNAPASTAESAQNGSASRQGTSSAAKADVSDVLASIRQHRGVLIDNFPSRPQTPKGTNALPPLLPADRSSAGSGDSRRDRGAGLIRSWVKAATTTSSSDSDSSPPSPFTSTQDEKAKRGRDAAVVEQPAADATRRRGLHASPPPLPVTAAASPPHLSPAAAAPTGPQAENPADNAAASVSISPMSPQLGSNAKTTPANETPIATPEPEGVQGSMDWMLQRSRAALEHVQRVLGETPTAESASSRALAPPPPLSSDMGTSTAAPKAETALTHAAYEIGVSTPSAERSPEDSLDYLSPLSVQHTENRGFPSPTAKPNGTATTSASLAAMRKEVVAVPDEPRYMMLCAVQDPARMAAMRRRRRCPGGGPDGHGSPSDGPSSAVGLNGTHASPQRRIAEVKHAYEAELSPRGAVAAAVAVEASAAAPVLPPLSPPSPSASSSSLHAALAATQPRRNRSPRSPVATTHKRPTPALHDDPSLLQELADFLRAGNGQGFSTLSAALAAPPKAKTAATTANVNAVSPHTRAQQRRSAPTVTAAPPPPPATVLLGHLPASSPSTLFDRTFTPSSELARVNTHDTAAAGGGSAAAPHTASARPHRSGALPSYAQPTISWLSKGSEASADDFPVTHATAVLTTPSSEPRTA